MKQLTPAYAKGFLDGYEIGEDRNPYPKIELTRRSEYRDGFNAGTKLYVENTATYVAPLLNKDNQ